jgi:hypothetical protein
MKRREPKHRCRRCGFGCRHGFIKPNDICYHCYQGELREKKYQDAEKAAADQTLHLFDRVLEEGP